MAVACLSILLLYLLGYLACFNIADRNKYLDFYVKSYDVVLFPDVFSFFHLFVEV